VLVGVIVAYHIAFRQGVFSTAKLRVILGGIPPEVKRYKKPWALLYGLPARKANHYAFCLPIILENRGNAPIKDVWIQISYPRGRDSSACKLEPNIYEIPGGVTRTARNVGDRALVEFNIPSIRPRDSMGIADLIVYSCNEFEKKRQSGSNGKTTDETLTHKFVIDQVRIYVHAENHKKSHIRAWLVAAISEDIGELESISGIVGKELYKLDKPLFMINAKPGSFIWLPPPVKLWTRRINLHQLGVHHMKDDIAIDVPGESMATFQTADVLPINVEQ